MYKKILAGFIAGAIMATSLVSAAMAEEIGEDCIIEELQTEDADIQKYIDELPEGTFDNVTFAESSDEQATVEDQLEAIKCLESILAQQELDKSVVFDTGEDELVGNTYSVDQNLSTLKTIILNSGSKTGGGYPCISYEPDSQSSTTISYRAAENTFVIATMINGSKISTASFTYDIARKNATSDGVEVILWGSGMSSIMYEQHAIFDITKYTKDAKLAFVTTRNNTASSSSTLSDISNSVAHLNVIGMAMTLLEHAYMSPSDIGFAKYDTVMSMKLSDKELFMYEGDTHKLTTSIFPEKAYKPIYSWTSSNTEVAKVGNDGTVTAVAIGTAVITVTCGDVSDTCNVTVSGEYGFTEDIILVKGQKDVYIGDFYKQKGDKRYKVTYSNPKVAKINAKGKVAAKKAGTTTVKLQSMSGEVTCTITVREPKLNKKLKMSIGSTQSIGLYGADGLKVQYSSSNPSVAAVDDEGNVTAVSKGSAKIITTINGKAFKTGIKVK